MLMGGKIPLPRTGGAPERTERKFSILSGITSTATLGEPDKKQAVCSCRIFSKHDID